MHILSRVELEWDERNAATNLKKHGLDFADASTVLYDDQALTIPDQHADEERFVTPGMDALGRILVVVYTWRARACDSYRLAKQPPESVNSTQVHHETRI